MKKTIKFFVIAAAAMTALVACNKDPKEDTPEVPTLVNANITTLTNAGVSEVDGALFKISVTGNGSEESFTADFIAPEGYLPTGSYTCAASGENTFSGHFKNSQVDEDITKGTIAVQRNNGGAYSIVGDLKLANGTILKLVANGNIAFEATEARYVYTATHVDYDLTASEKFGKVVSGTSYKIYENDGEFDIKKAEVFYVGEEGVTGEFSVSMDGAEGAILLGYEGMKYGTFWYGIPEWEAEFNGIAYIMMGKVKISKAWNQLTFDFVKCMDQSWGTKDLTFAGCKKVDSVKEPVSGDPEDHNFTYTLDTKAGTSGYDHTLTLYDSYDRVFCSMTYNLDVETPYREFDKAENHKIVSAEEYASNPSNCATNVYYYINGEKIQVEPGNYIVVRYVTVEGKEGIAAGGLICDTSMKLPADFQARCGSEWGFAAMPR
ncbi:MAG: hypothetical protein MJY53_06010 [Bacteroidales bacterium]|nr:hypothetical protein [Bacteroidales bacterium]